MEDERKLLSAAVENGKLWFSIELNNKHEKKKLMKTAIKFQPDQSIPKSWNERENKKEEYSEENAELLCTVQVYSTTV